MQELVVPAIDNQQHKGLLVASVSSFLIMLVLQPLVKNAISASRSICSLWWALVWLLARDDSAVADEGVYDDDHHSGGIAGMASLPPRHCEQCASRGTPSFSDDVAAVVGSLGLAGGMESDEGVFASGIDYHQVLCGGCAAMAVVEELTESKVASEAELREAFYVFDRDEDGFVTPGELWNVMRRLGMPEGARYEDCRRMIAAHDGDGDGRISFREFRAMMENAA